MLTAIEAYAVTAALLVIDIAVWSLIIRRCIQDSRRSR
jgi:hypothetical protein